MKIDHGVQLVEDMENAIVAWKDMGFTVSPGGIHADGLTHNALVTFRDGSYIELLAFRSKDVGQHRWARYRGFWGPIDYAISIPDLSTFAPHLKTKGLPYSDMSNGGRTRPDGIELKWRSVFATDQTLGLPFFIEDVTDRSLRVPMHTDSVLHPNAATGIADVHVAVPDLNLATGHFELLFGEAHISSNTSSFKLDGSTLTISQPIANTPEAALVARRGAGPITFTIAAPTLIVIKPASL